jgi:hypothetical protein
MAVLTEALSVIVRVKTVLEKLVTGLALTLTRGAPFELLAWTVPPLYPSTSASWCCSMRSIRSAHGV